MRIMVLGCAQELDNGAHALGQPLLTHWSAPLCRPLTRSSNTMLLRSSLRSSSSRVTRAMMGARKSLCCEGRMLVKMAPVALVMKVSKSRPVSAAQAWVGWGDEL